MKFTYKISYIFISVLSMLLACNTTGPSRDEIDKVIKKYDRESFDEFRNVFISERSKTGNEIVYLLHKFEDDLAVYFVHYDLINGRILKIDDKMLKNRGMAGYFTEQEIADIIKKFRKYKVYLLGVDDDGNIYLNPFYSNEPPFLLKLKNTPKDREVKKGYMYTLYKGNWYLNKTKG